MVRNLWRRMTGRCQCCGQKSIPGQSVEERVRYINKKAERLAESLGRKPRLHVCRQCRRLILEGQPGYNNSLLLIDME